MTDAEKFERELQKILEEYPEAFEAFFGPKQPFDSNTRPYDIFECKGGGWGVVLDRSPDGNIRTGGPFGTKEAALAFVAEYTPRNS